MGLLLGDLGLLAQALWDGLLPILAVLFSSLRTNPVATIAVIALFVFIWQGLS